METDEYETWLRVRGADACSTAADARSTDTSTTADASSTDTGAYAYADARGMFHHAGERWLLCTARGHRDSLGSPVFRGRNVDKR